MTYYASVDCFSKEVLFKYPGEPEFQFQGKRNRSSILISILKGRMMLTKGCEGFLACVVADDSGKVLLGDIHMVREFPDVFLEDLHGLPFNQEIEISIVLLPGTTSIFQSTLSDGTNRAERVKGLTVGTS